MGNKTIKKQVNVRMSVEQIDQIKELAVQDERSFSSEIIVLLKEAVEQRNKMEDK